MQVKTKFHFVIEPGGLEQRYMIPYVVILDYCKTTKVIFTSSMYGTHCLFSVLV